MRDPWGARILASESRRSNPGAAAMSQPSIEDHITSVIEAAVEKAVREALPSSLNRSEGPNQQPVGLQLVSVDSAAKILAVSPATIRRMTDSGALPGIRCLGALRIDLQDIQAFINNQKDQGISLP